jgi:hypothetical protein
MTKRYFSRLIGLSAIAVISTLLLRNCLAAIEQQQLTESHREEMKAAVTQYWTVRLSLTNKDDPAVFATVATGRELSQLFKGFQFTPSYSSTLQSVEIMRVIEYSPQCSQVKSLISYGSEEEWARAGMHEHLIFLKEDNLWKVADADWILPKSDVQKFEELFQLSVQESPLSCANY